MVYLSRLETGIEQFANQVGQGDVQTFRFMMSLGDKTKELEKAERDYEGDGKGRSEVHRKLAEMPGLEWRPEDEAGY